MAREVVETYRDTVPEHPVGTGAVPARRLAAQLAHRRWSATRRSASCATTASPPRRRRRRGAAAQVQGPAPADDRSASRSRSSRRASRAGCRFLNGEFDLDRGAARVRRPGRAGRTDRARTSPSRASRWTATPSADRTLSYFNMDDPIVGGYTPEKVALRRAISLATDVAARDQQHPARPGDPGAVDHRAGRLRLRPGATQRQQRLRRRPCQGAARHLRLRRPRRRRLARAARRLAARPRRTSSAPDAIYRQFDEIWQKNLDAIGMRMLFKTAQWPEQLKAARAGTLHDLVARLHGVVARWPGCVAVHVRAGDRRPEPRRASSCRRSTTSTGAC